MKNTQKIFGAVCGLWMIATVAHAGGWEYAFSAEHGVHIAAGPAATGAQGVNEIVQRYCVVSRRECAWSMSVAVPCKHGDDSLAVVVSHQLKIPGTDRPAASFLKCGGPNSGLPGTFVYLIERDDVVRELVKVNGPIVMRVGNPKVANPTDVTLDFRGAAPFVARAEAGLKAR